MVYFLAGYARLPALRYENETDRRQQHENPGTLNPDLKFINSMEPTEDHIKH